MALPEDPEPNTVIDLDPLGWPGTMIVLNEQIITGNGQDELRIVTTALRVVFDVSVFDIELSGDVAFGRSSAAVTDCAESVSADLSVGLDATRSPVIIGEPLTYTIEVSNNGPDQAANLVITDIVPVELSINSINPGPGVNCARIVNQIACIASSLASGAKASAEITVTPNTDGVFTNRVEVNAGSNDPVSDNNWSVLSMQVEPFSSDLSVNLTPSTQQVIVGNVLNYKVDVYNDGPDDAADYVVSVTLPARLSILAVRAGAGISCNHTGQQVSCSGTALASSGSVTININTRANSMGAISTAVGVSSGTYDPDQDNNQTSVSGTVMAKS